MKERRYKLIIFFFILSLAFFIVGIFLDRETMKFAASGIILLAGISIYSTWIQPSFLSEESITFNLAVATSHSFVFLAFALGVIFLVDSFLFPIENMVFAIFGSVFLSLIVASLYLAYKLRTYI